MIVIAAAFALAVAFGILAVAAWRPLRNPQPAWAGVLLQASLGMGAGLGATSALFFVSLLIGITSPWLTFALVLASTATFAVIILKRKGTPTAMAPAAATGFRWNWVLAVALGLGLLIVGSALVELTAGMPHGDWDAWAIWNLRARFLAGPGDSWRHAISPLLWRTHPEYPLLLSGWIGWVWKLAGETSTVVPAATALLFTCGALALVAAGVALLRGSTAALTAALVALSSPAYLLETGAQYADIPLGFYYGATLVLILLGGPRALALAGLCAGLAAWTKNEGIAFLVWAAVCQLLVAWWRKVPFRPFALGALPGALLAAGFKVFLAPATDPVFRQTPAQLFAKILDFGRYLEIGKAVFVEIYRFGNGISHPVILLALAAFALGFELRNERDRFVPPAAILALMFATYYGFYIVVPEDLAWRLQTSLGRLYTHLWPAFLVIFFFALGRPEPAGVPVPPGPPVKLSPKRKRARTSEKRP